MALVSMAETEVDRAFIMRQECFERAKDAQGVFVVKTAAQPDQQS